MLVIIGCGNSNRSDDGVGVEIARRLTAWLDSSAAPSSMARHVEVHDAGTDGMGVMYKARGAEALWIVDASRSGAAPGSIYQVPGDELERVPGASLNLHDFRWDNALFVGRKIFGEEFPTEVEVFLIEAKDLSLGLELSSVVEASCQQLIERMTGMINQRYSDQTEVPTSARGACE